MEVEEEFESVSEEMEMGGVGGPDVGRTECFFSFVFSSCFLSFGGRGEGEREVPLGQQGTLGCRGTVASRG